MTIMKKKGLINIGILSNIFEWYDFSVYAFIAVTMGQLFFASDTSEMAFIKAFSLFSVSYFARPIGSLFFGYLSDRYSRSLSLKTSLTMMAIPTVIIGLLPTYWDVGVVATVALIILRLIQGFAAGGELPNSACYVYESAPKENKTFYCSFVASSSMMGVLLGSMTASMLYLSFSEQEILAWAWRIPFIASIVIALFIFYIRKQIVEPDKFNGEKLVYHKTLNEVRKNKFSLLQIMLINIFISIAFYLLFVWMPSYLHVFLNIDAKQAFLSGTIGLFALIVFTLSLGYFAHRIGRRKLALCSIFSIMVLSYPLFTLLKDGSFSLIIASQLLFALCLSCIESVNVEIMGSRFGRAFRGRGVGLGFTIPTAIFGGAAPTICSYLIDKTGSDLSPILFLIVACFIALPAVISIKK